MKQPKKRIGRPSENKTTLAVLRKMLTVPKKDGNYGGERVPLDVKTVASWLNVKPDSVRAMEWGRKGYALTHESAQILGEQTGINPIWLVAGVPKNPFNWAGKPFKQADFDHQQRNLERNIRIRFQMEIQRVFEMFSFAMLHSYQHGQFPFCMAKVQTAVLEIYKKLGMGSSLPHIATAAHCHPTETRPDLKPIVDELERRFKKIAVAVKK